MASKLDSQRLEEVFKSRPDIISGIKRAADSPDRVALFNNITNYVHERTLGGADEPALKKRKVAAGQDANGSAAGTNAADEAVLLEVKEISVSIPQRKKFELCFTANHLYARAPGTTTPAPGIIYSWEDIEYAFYLPVPDKAQVQHNYLLFPKGTSLPSKTNQTAIDPLVFTVPATAPKPGTIGGSEAGSAAAVSDTYKSLFHWALGKRLKTAGSGVDIVSADPNKFQSTIRQPHRPNEKAVHVGGFRGSKDGYLFFLENGILWGFKKPLIFLPLNRIVAISYTNILQITFNMVVEVLTGDGDTTEELEFGMLDQKDFGGIDEYVKSNRLQDRSMAEQRKAKLQLAENRAKKNGDGAENGEEGAASAGDGAADKEDADMTQLQQAEMEAEQQFQDDEDEDEEDYDPGSEGDSEGSGSSSEEDGDEDEEVGDDDDDDGGEDEVEAEEEGDGEEVEEEEEEATEEPVVEKVVKKEVVEKKMAQRPAEPPVQVTQRSGWATSNPQPAAAASDDLEMDETFDVV